MTSRFNDAATCGEAAPSLGLVPPPPGQRRLARRVGEFNGFVADLVRSVEAEQTGTTTFAHLWDVAGDPRATQLVRLWAFVAESVAAYAELTAGEAYVGTAADWTDLRRLAALVGYAPHARIAAQGWVRADVDAKSAPLVPAGTRVQAPAKGTRAMQTFETAADTQLYGDWTNLTATRPFTAAAPGGATIRFASDPGFRTGDRVLFLDGQRPLAVANVIATKADIGTALVTFDRDLTIALTDAADLAAHRVRESSGTARRLEDVVAVTKGDSGFEADAVSLGDAYDTDETALGEEFVVTDALLAQVSAGSLVALVAWGEDGTAVLRTVERNVPVQWHVAPGTTVRVSRLDLKEAVDRELWLDEPPSVYVVDEAVSAWHQVPDTSQPGRVRIFPAPAHPPDHLALESVAVDGTATWSVFGCTADTPQPLPGEPWLMTLDGDPDSGADRWRASANLLRVRHGATTRGVVGSGDAARAFQRLPLPKAPVAHDLAEDGTPVPSLLLRVDGVEWTEVPTLFEQGDAQVFTTTLAADGGETVEFGDGVDGARPATGSGNVVATYRVGGGTEGEVGEGEITALLGQVRGVKKVVGGPASGGADQDDERRLRTLAPARARALGRVVSREDAVDVALAYPGVSHAAAWPAGAATQVAFLRHGNSGPKAPAADEVASLASYLAARRDTTFPLLVLPGRVTTVALRAELALDPKLDPAKVLAAVAAALGDPDGPLDADARSLGQPLEPSDIYAVVHSVPGVVGVASLALDGAAVDELQPLAAARDELLLLAAAQDLQEAKAT